MDGLGSWGSVDEVQTQIDLEMGMGRRWHGDRGGEKRWSGSVLYSTNLGCSLSDEVGGGRGCPWGEDASNVVDFVVEGEAESQCGYFRRRTQKLRTEILRGLANGLVDRDRDGAPHSTGISKSEGERKGCCLQLQLELRTVSDVA
jgi:hypothetical protein